MFIISNSDNRLFATLTQNDKIEDGIKGHRNSGVYLSMKPDMSMQRRLGKTTATEQPRSSPTNPGR